MGATTTDTMIVAGVDMVAVVMIIVVVATVGMTVIVDMVGETAMTTCHEVLIVTLEMTVTVDEAPMTVEVEAVGTLTATTEEIAVLLVILRLQPPTVIQPLAVKAVIHTEVETTTKRDFLVVNIKC